MKSLTTAFFILVAVATYAQQADYLVHFPKSSPVLSVVEAEALDRWIDANSDHLDVPVLLRGHTDRDGNEGYNKILSTQRNQAVKDYLQKAGFSDVRLEAFGETWPLSNGLTETEMGADRRVEIVLADSPEEQFALEQKLPAPQVYFVDATNEMRIEAEKGTRIIIPGGVLYDKKGNPVQSARVEVREFYSKPECISSLLTTTCDGQRLESGGMAEIRAYSGNDELTLSDGATYQVDFAGEAANEEGMQLFNGVVENGILNWVPVDETKRPITVTERDYGNYPELVRQINSGTLYETDYRVTDSLIVIWNNQTLSIAGYAASSGKLDEVLAGNKFGWINCDKFSKMNASALRTVSVDMGDLKPGGRSFLVFTKSNSVMQGAWMWENGKNVLVWDGIPKNETGIVISNRKGKDGENLFGHAVIGADNSYRLSLTETPEEEMEAFIAGLK
ncbi:MAG: OmpA family protein [Flavobacteriales bacterium]|nr:OmpA family protein [Flavobacteriales bacterium]